MPDFKMKCMSYVLEAPFANENDDTVRIVFSPIAESNPDCWIENFAMRYRLKAAPKYVVGEIYPLNVDG